MLSLPGLGSTILRIYRPDCEQNRSRLPSKRRSPFQLGDRGRTWFRAVGLSIIVSDDPQVAKGEGTFGTVGR